MWSMSNDYDEELNQQVEETLISDSLEDQAKDRFSDKVVSTLKRIALHVGRDGLTLKESCQLLNLDFQHVNEIVEKDDLVQDIISNAELRYKRNLLKTLSEKARSKDDKVATWLLERRYPDEFGKKKRGSKKDNDGASLEEVVKFVRESGDDEPLIANETEENYTPKRKLNPKESDDVVKQVEDILT